MEVKFVAFCVADVGVDDLCCVKIIFYSNKFFVFMFVDLILNGVQLLCTFGDLDIYLRDGLINSDVSVLRGLKFDLNLLHYYF